MIYARMFPELLRFENVAARSAAWGRATSIVFWSIWYWVFLVCVLVVALLVKETLWKYIVLPVPGGYLPFSIVTAMVALYGGIWLFRRRVRRSLREQLNAAGKPTCMKCGYDLRGLPEPRCPECATPFDPQRADAGEAESTE